MYNVNSKYRNPDKYIQILKNQAAEAWQRSNENYEMYKNEIGEQIAIWESGQIRNQSCNSHKLGILRPGDIIHQIGKVTKVVIVDDNSNIDFEMLQTRKVINR